MLMDKDIKAIIFDFGNVLVNWDVREVYKHFFTDDQAIESFLTEIRFLEWNAQQDAGRPFSEGVSALSKEFPKYSDLIASYDTHWEESITDTIEGTVEIVKELKSEGWKLYLLSNFSVEKFELIRHRYDFLDLFEKMIISGEYKLIKPDPEIFTLTLQLIGRKASECLFIDDSPTNIEVAQKLGFNAIHFKSAEQLRIELNKYTTRIINDN